MISAADLTAIVLAGGRSARYGSDKLAVEVDGASILDRALASVAALTTDIVVVGSSRSISKVRTVDDPEPFGGPLQALAGALAVTTTELALVVAGDMPTLVPGVLALIVDHLRSNVEVDAVVLQDPRDPSRRQPLPLALRVEPARRAASVALGAGDRSLVRLLGRSRLAEVPVDRWLALDPDARTLADIDLPEDIDRLRIGAPDQRKR